MILSQDFREFIKSLNSHDVHYLIVGGYAVGFHGYPRYTKDLDVWIDRAESNIFRLMVALNEFSFGDVGLTSKDFLEAGHIIQLGYPPNRIDILTSAKGANFAECFATKVSIEIDEIVLHFVGLEELKQIKKAAGRPQDLADLDNLRD